ncbi:hypothetical protein FACS1894152_1630 [Bacilli bacterium]|nr:hypothetical protein FACS1894152_1630 [Bacilli bacterium]
MDIKKITLPTGSILRFKYCSMGDFQALKKIILHHVNIKLDDSFMSRPVVEMMKMLARPLLGSITSLLADGELDEVLLKCAGVCLLNDERITKDLFEWAPNRKDYYPLMYNVLLENVKVFLQGLELTEFNTSVQGNIDSKITK